MADRICTLSALRQFAESGKSLAEVIEHVAENHLEVKCVEKPSTPFGRQRYWVALLDSAVNKPIEERIVAERELRERAAGVRTL